MVPSANIVAGGSGFVRLICETSPPGVEAGNAVWVAIVVSPARFRACGLAVAVCAWGLWVGLETLPDTGNVVVDVEDGVIPGGCRLDMGWVDAGKCWELPGLDMKSRVSTASFSTAACWLGVRILARGARFGLFCVVAAGGGVEGIGPVKLCCVRFGGIVDE